MRAGLRKLRNAIRAYPKPRNDADFRYGIWKLLGIRGVELKQLDLQSGSVRFDTSIRHQQLDDAVVRKSGGIASFHGIDQDLRAWAFGITAGFCGGGMAYGSGSVRGWRDKKRLSDWSRARDTRGVAPARRNRKPVARRKAGREQP